MRTTVSCRCGVFSTSLLSGGGSERVQESHDDTYSITKINGWYSVGTPPGTMESGPSTSSKWEADIVRTCLSFRPSGGVLYPPRKFNGLGLISRRLILFLKGDRGRKGSAMEIGSGRKVGCK
jgi:hypothetical protein